MSRSTGGAGALLASLVGISLLGQAGCASPPPGPHANAPRSLFAFVDRGPGKAPAVVHQDAQGVWRIERGVLEDDRRDTPRRTLRAFIDALERADYGALRALAPAELRTDMTLESLREHVEADSQGAANLLERLKAHVDSPIRLQGQSAEMPYAGSAFEMQFEEGGWVVVDAD